FAEHRADQPQGDISRAVVNDRCGNLSAVVVELVAHGGFVHFIDNKFDRIETDFNGRRGRKRHAPEKHRSREKSADRILPFSQFTHLIPSSFVLHLATPGVRKRYSKYG